MGDKIILRDGMGLFGTTNRALNCDANGILVSSPINPPAPPPIGPVMDDLKLWYKFNEGSGGTLGDSAGTNPATMQGSGHTWGAGLKDGSIDFNGTSWAKAAIAYPYILPDLPVSFEMWIKPDVGITGAHGNILFYGHNSSYAGGHVIQMDTVNGVMFVFNTGSAWIQSGVYPDDTTFHQVVVVGQADGYYHLYIDGILRDTSVSGMPEGHGIVNQTLIVGGFVENEDWIRPFLGSICCVRLYKRALSVPEITQNYNWERS